jgi:hypothetical protein
MTMRVLCLAMLAIGCGGAGSPPTKEGTAVMGSFLGNNFVATNAVSFSRTDFWGTVGVVVISTSEALCSALQAGHLPPESRNLWVEVFEIDASGRMIAPASAGRYFETDALVGPAKFSGTSYVETDAGCGYLATESKISQSGVVTLTDIAGGVYSGSISIMMTSQDGAAGTIQPELCPGGGLVPPAPRC